MSEITERLRRLSRAARESGKVAAEDRESRDNAIGEAEDMGMGVREIARHTELSVSQVHRLVVQHLVNTQDEYPFTE